MILDINDAIDIAYMVLFGLSIIGMALGLRQMFNNKNNRQDANEEIYQQEKRGRDIQSRESNGSRKGDKER